MWLSQVYGVGAAEEGHADVAAGRRRAHGHVRVEAAVAGGCAEVPCPWVWRARCRGVFSSPFFPCTGLAVLEGLLF